MNRRSLLKTALLACLGFTVGHVGAKPGSGEKSKERDAAMPTLRELRAATKKMVIHRIQPDHNGLYIYRVHPSVAARLESHFAGSGFVPVRNYGPWIKPYALPGEVGAMEQLRFVVGAA